MAKKKRRKKRRSPRMNRFCRDTVWERDNKRCKNCSHRGSKRNPLTVHHIKPRCQYPKLVNDPKNCILLCSRCHEEHH